MQIILFAYSLIIMKNGKKSLKFHKWTNFRPKLSLWHFVIEPVILYDKSIDDLVLY